MGQYKDLSNDTKQLAVVLREVDDLVQDESHADLFKSDFTSSLQSCNILLTDLGACLDQYKSLGTNSRSLPDRMKWDQEQVKRLHARISGNVQMLSMSLHRYNTSTQVKVVRLLNEILDQLRTGKRKAESVSSFAAAREGQADQAWPEIVNELSDLGLHEEDANDNRDLIIGILREARFDGFDAELEDEPPSQLPSQSRPRSIPRRSPYLSTPATETVTSSSPNDRVFSDVSHSEGPESVTSFDSMGLESFASLRMPSSTKSRKYLSIFDPVAMDIEADVKRQPNTLRDDINLAKRYWADKDWGNCKKRLLRLLVTSELPHHRRPDLSPKLITFLLGIACTYSGDLETARLAFSALLAESMPPGSRPTSPGSVSPSPNPDFMLEDSGIAAATWLGDICLMTDRGADAAFAYALVLDSLRRKSLAFIRRNSGAAEVPAVHPLNQSALKIANNSLNVANVKSTHEQLIACELDVVNTQIHHLDDLMEHFYAEDFPHRVQSIFEDIPMPPGPHSIAHQAQSPIGGLSSNTYPLMKEFKSYMGTSCLTYGVLSEGRRRRQHAIRLGGYDLTPIDERLTLRASRAGWPLMWNPDFSFCAPLYAMEWFHNITTAPEDTLLSKPKALAQTTVKALDPDFVVSKEEAEAGVAGVCRWLKGAHIDFKQFPDELRCHPQSDHTNKWPDVAVFAIKVYAIKAEGLFKKPKIALCVTDVMLWDGTFDLRASDSASSSAKALLEAFKAQIKSTDTVVRQATRSE